MNEEAKFFKNSKNIDHLDISVKTHVNILGYFLLVFLSINFQLQHKSSLKFQIQNLFKRKKILKTLMTFSHLSPLFLSQLSVFLSLGKLF